MEGPLTSVCYPNSNPPNIKAKEELMMSAHTVSGDNTGQCANKKVQPQTFRARTLLKDGSSFIGGIIHSWSLTTFDWEDISKKPRLQVQSGANVQLKLFGGTSVKTYVKRLRLVHAPFVLSTMTKSAIERTFIRIFIIGTLANHVFVKNIKLQWDHHQLTADLLNELFHWGVRLVI